MSKYEIIIYWSTDDDAFVAEVPELPGCITQGDTIEEAIEMAKEAIELYVEELQSRGEKIPDNTDTLEYSLNLQIAS